MGVWGTAIFSDDNAADIREEYRTLLGDDISGPEATDRLIHEWQPSSNHDPDLAAVFWLALAVTQWKCGRLEERVKREAIQAIDGGAGLRPWKGSGQEKQRAKVLDATRRLLHEPQPPARKIAKVFRSSCDWQPGDLVAYRLVSGSYIVFQVTDLHQDKGGTAPVCEIYDWQGPALPSPADIRSCPMRPQTTRWGVTAAKPNRPPQYRLMILQANKREFPRPRVFPLHQKLAVQHPPKPKGTSNPTLVCLWRELDETLKKHYGFA
jgi:hypothetical protein